MILYRKYSPILDWGTKIVDDGEHSASIDDSDERIADIVEHGRKEYYEAWIEYVHGYD